MGEIFTIVTGYLLIKKILTVLIGAAILIVPIMLGVRWASRYAAKQNAEQICKTYQELTKLICAEIKKATDN